MEDNDALLQLKKRARRRLVGAVFLAGSAVFILGMLMNPQPPDYLEKHGDPRIVVAGQGDPEVRIPGQDEKPFAPRFSEAPQTVTTVSSAANTTTTLRASAVPVSPSTTRKPEVASGTKSAGKPSEKPAAREQKPADKPAEQKAGAADESRRAAAILAGKSPEAAGGSVPHVILIGAFANPANVRNLQTKLGQLGIKVYTEPLNSPQGKKTRVRAGPFPNRESGERALEKMKRIGVSGVLTARQ